PLRQANSTATNGDPPPGLRSLKGWTIKFATLQCKRNLMGTDARAPIVTCEIDAIKARYARRDTKTQETPRRLLDRFAFLASNERRRLLLDAIHRWFGDRDARSLTALDIGCGAGGTLLQYLEFGFQPERLTGVELTSHRATEARHRLPAGVR